MLETYEEPVLVDFYAVWCGPCQLMSKELQSLGSKLSTSLKVAKVDTDNYPQLGDKYNIEGLPTCVLFKGGKEVKRFVGVIKADQMEEVSEERGEAVDERRKRERDVLLFSHISPPPLPTAAFANEQEIQPFL